MLPQLKRSVLPILLSLLFTTVYSQEELKFSVNDCITYALSHHSSSLNAEADIRIARKQVREITGLGLPQVTVSSDFTNFLEIPSTFIPADFFGGTPGTYQKVQFGQPYSTSTGINVNQLIFDGTYIIGLKAASTFKELSRINADITRTELAINVSKAYYNALLIAEQHKVVASNKTRLELLVKESQTLYESGFAEKIDADRLKIAYNNVLIEEDRLRQLSFLSLNLVKFQMGMPFKENLILTDLISDVPLILDEDISLLEYMKRNDYRAMQTQIELQHLNVKRQMSAFIPSISAFGSASVASQSSNFDFSELNDNSYTSSLVGVRLTWNVFNSGSKISRVGQQKLELYKLKNSRTQMEQLIDLQVEQAKVNYNAGVAMVAVQKENKELAEEIFRVANIKYKEGVGSNLELVEAELSLRTANTGYVQSYHDAVLAKLELQRALGILTY